MSYPLTLYFDGECPLCSREISFLKKRDTNSHLRFVDISDQSLADETLPKSRDELMAFFHAQTSDGKLLVGVDAFSKAYEGIGLGFLFFPTKLPLLRHLFHFSYLLFAQVRVPIGSLLNSCSRKGHCSATKS